MMQFDYGDNKNYAIVVSYHCALKHSCRIICIRFAFA